MARQKSPTKQGALDPSIEARFQQAFMTTQGGFEDSHKYAEFVADLVGERLDTKLDGIPASVLAQALQQARDARMTILDVMNEAIDAPDEMAPTAPRVISIRIPVDKIGEVIGPKGKIINQIQEETGADITIQDDGTIYIGDSEAHRVRVLLAALAAYFIDTYGIYIDKVMIRNVFETDPGEAAELLTVKLLLYILAMAVLPGLIVWRIPVAQIGFTRELLHKLGVLAFTVAGVLRPRCEEV